MLCLGDGNSCSIGDLNRAALAISQADSGFSALCAQLVGNLEGELLRDTREANDFFRQRQLAAFCCLFS